MPNEGSSSTAESEEVEMRKRHLDEFQQIVKQHDASKTKVVEELLSKQLEELLGIAKQHDEAKMEELESMIKRQHDEDNAQLLEDRRQMYLKMLEEGEPRLQKQHDETNTKLKERQRMLKKQLKKLERMKDEENINLWQKPERMLEKQLKELKRMLEKQHNEANTKLLEEMLEKQLKELRQILVEQHEDEARKKKSEEKQRSLEKQKDYVTDLQTRAFKCTYYYFVLQLVVFSAVTNDSSPSACRYVWFLVVLSVFPAIVNLFALGFINWKHRNAIQHQHESFIDLERHMKMPAKSSNEIVGQERTSADIPHISSWEVIFFDACMVVFLLVTIFIGVGSYWKLCREKNS